MSLEKQNIPAFPQSEPYTNQEGMTLLDYYAAHAPVKPPKWWGPVMREKPKNMLRLNQHFTEQKRNWIEMYFDDDGEWHDKDPQWIDASNPPDIPDSFKEEVREYLDRWNKNCEETQQWEKDEEYERLVQWPYYYATQLLKRREACMEALKHIESTKQQS